LSLPSSRSGSNVFVASCSRSGKFAYLHNLAPNGSSAVALAQGLVLIFVIVAAFWRCGATIRHSGPDRPTEK